MVVSKVQFVHMKNDEFLAFMQRVGAVLDSSGDKASKRARAFMDALLAYSKVMETPDNYRHALTELDAYCDRIWLSLMHQVLASQFHFDEERAKAGAEISRIMDDYGNVTYLNYEEEYALIGAALNRLDALPAWTLQWAHIDDLVAELHKGYDAFMGALADENEHRAAIEYGIVKDARKALYCEWKYLISWLNLQSLDNASYNDIIDKINIIIQDMASLCMENTNDVDDAND